MQDTITKKFNKIDQQIEIEKVYALNFPAIAGRLEELGKEFFNKKAFTADQYSKTKALKTAFSFVEKEIKHILTESFRRNTCPSRKIALHNIFVRKHAGLGRVEIEFSFTCADELRSDGGYSATYISKSLTIGACSASGSYQVLDSLEDLGKFTPPTPPSFEEVKEQKRKLKELTAAYEADKQAILKNIPYFAK